MKTRFLATVLLLAVTGCAKTDNKYSYDGVGDYNFEAGEVVFRAGKLDASTQDVPSLSADERKQYCAIYTEAEQDPTIVKLFLEKLDGKWHRDVKSTGMFDTPFAAVFGFSEALQRASLSGAFLAPSEEITAKHICVSQALSRSDAYDGFRIVEFEADNNEGTAVSAFKFARPQLGHGYPVLWMVERQYYRHGQTDPVRPDSALFGPQRKGESSARIWVYPTRE